MQRQAVRLVRGAEGVRATLGGLRHFSRRFNRDPVPKWTAKKRPEAIFSVDRSGLHKPSAPTTLDNPNKETPSPLAKDVLSMIQMRGPITVHDYMALALHHSQHGYYHSNAEKIGNEGDFVTAPELSQVFGEVIGLWLYTAFLAMGKPEKIVLMELGPGKGTLMEDIVRVVRRFPDFARALQIQMVEASQSMRRLQHQALLGAALPAGQQVADGQVHASKDGFQVSWTTYLDQGPQDCPALVVGQEFLDAFPVHQFIRTRDGWREKLIDLDPSDSPHHFRVVMAPQETPAVRSLLSADRGILDPAAQYAEGHQLEVCPLALSTCLAVGKRIKERGGAALFIDYGHDHTPDDSIRGFKRHRQVSFLSEPGVVDMTVDVDFKQCRRVAEGTGAAVLPLQTQGRFLGSLGIVQRVQQLIAQDSVSDEEAQALVGALKFLLEPDKMGEKFKVFCTAHPDLAPHLPGFQ